MAMKYSFAELGNNILTRKFGGTSAGVADPYTSGYFFFWLDKVPPGLIKGTGFEEAEISTILAASCTGVTPPGGTLNKIEYTGLGGVKWAVPGNVDYGNTVSVKFIEFNKTPILNIMHNWVKMIRDYRTGVSGLIDGEDGSGYTKSKYAGLAYYWTTTPDCQSIEYYACFDGMFPSKDPQDLYSGDVETAGRLDVEIEFNVDYAWHEQWVYDKIQSTFLPELLKSKGVVEKYGETEGK